ncbi:D-alanyl-D-alanine carboxypeptidase (penicillin-binding protein 5/6) [Ruminococcaceae bacterium FB2012]|nr:D-alanyl-D-alanine carboxypeptidase (penicillin-binding protein 5/6) [Ruminococcaceae bacterium FB2012]
MDILSIIAAAVMSLSACLSVPAAKAQDSEPAVPAKGCVVIDAISGDVLYAKNESEKLPMASTTKIMSAYIALHQDGLDTPFIVDSEAIKVEGSSMGLREGDRVTLRQLVCGMLLPSGNDAANAAAVRIAGSVPAFVKLMNSYAAEMGLSDTHFVTPSGLDDYTDEHYSTALDMAKLTRESLKLDSFREICGSRTMQLDTGKPNQKRWLSNTNRLLGMCEGCIGVKTGFTDKAGRCLVSACEREGSTLICVTLNDKNDWEDHKALYDRCFGLMRDTELPPELSGYKIDCPDKGAALNAVGESGSIRLPHSAVGRLRRVTLIPPLIYLPVKEGEQVGSTKFYLDGELIASLPIKTAG